MATRRKWLILLAEDDSDDQMFARRAVSLCGPSVRMEVVEDGEELVQYLRQEGAYSDARRFPRPDLILLDLNMPRKSGREALKEIKSDPALRRIPVVVMTTSTAETDITQSYDQGSNAYVVKPLEYDRLCSAIKAVGLFWFGTARLTGR